MYAHGDLYANCCLLLKYDLNDTLHYTSDTLFTTMINTAHKVNCKHILFLLYIQNLVYCFNESIQIFIVTITQDKFKEDIETVIIRNTTYWL